MAIEHLSDLYQLLVTVNAGERQHLADVPQARSLVLGV